MIALAAARDVLVALVEAEFISKETAAEAIEALSAVAEVRPDAMTPLIGASHKGEVFLSWPSKDQETTIVVYPDGRHECTIANIEAGEVVEKHVARASPP